MSMTLHWIGVSCFFVFTFWTTVASVNKSELCWHSYTLTRYNGLEPTKQLTVASCQDYCYNLDPCYTINFDIFSQSPCSVQTSGIFNISNVQLDVYYVVNYRLDTCGYQTPSQCPPSFRVHFNSTSSHDGVSPPRTLSEIECVKDCLGAPSTCAAVDYSSDTASCWRFMFPDWADDLRTFNSLSTQYVVERSCNLPLPSCSFQFIKNTSSIAIDTFFVSVVSLGECLHSCLTNKSCVAVDYMYGSLCSMYEDLELVISNRVSSRFDYSSQFILNRVNCPGEEMLTAPTTATPTRSPIELLLCMSSPCGNNGSCMDFDGDFTCSCYEGFVNLQPQQCVDFNECSSASPPCQNNGTCLNTVGSFQCICSNDYYGVRCQIYKAPSPLITPPSLDATSTKVGILAGGTEFVISGMNFDLFPPIFITFEPDNSMLQKLPGRIKNNSYYGTPTRFTLISPAVPNNSEAYTNQKFTIKITFLKNHTASLTFRFASNPNISDITPRDPLLTPRGSVWMMVRGSNMDVVSNSVLTAYLRLWNSSSFDTLFSGDGSSPCVASDGSNMRCQLPVFPFNIPASQLNSSEVGKQLSLGFKMDNFPKFANLNKSRPDLIISPKFSLPIISPTDVVLEVDPSKLSNVFIQGSGLDSGISKVDYLVEIGNSTCAVTDLSTNMLQCSPPPTKPATNNLSSSHCTDQLAVVVKVVGSKYFYQCAEYLESRLKLSYIIGFSVGSAVLLMVIIVIIVLVTRKVSKKRKNSEGTEDVNIPYSSSSPNFGNAEPSVMGGSIYSTDLNQIETVVGKSRNSLMPMNMPDFRNPSAKNSTQPYSGYSNNLNDEHYDNSLSDDHYYNL